MLTEKAVESTDQSLHEVRHLIERIKNQLSFGNLRLAERYINAELKILARLSFIGGSGEIYDLVACYERYEPLRVKPQCLSDGEINSPLVHGRDGSEQESMLVHNIELMEEPERLIESRVWLYRVGDNKRFGRDDRLPVAD
jgi:hypothetical protein